MYKRIFLILLCLLCFGCNDKKGTNQFIEEFKKYNGDYIKLELENADMVHYSDVDEINKIIKSGTGVIFVGKASDNLSRRAVDVLLQASDSTDLDSIYYLNSLDGVLGLDKVESLNVPLVLFVLDGDVVSYHIGTIDNKIDLSEDETIELYNQYLEGIHKVLQDACDESC